VPKYTAKYNMSLNDASQQVDVSGYKTILIIITNHC